MSPNHGRVLTLVLRGIFSLAMTIALFFSQQPLLAQTTDDPLTEQVENLYPQTRQLINLDNWWAAGLAEQAALDGPLSELLETESAESEADEPVTLPFARALDNWSKIAYQSARDDNWEIYTAQGNGGSAFRVTNNPASDVYPRLNHGADRILFASNRGGNYDIYTMNSDGSGVVGLAPHPATDTMPTWSKDGGRIAFASDRDSEKPDIYVMNGDGSDFYRIRIDNTIDIMPRMAPDSHQIAWIRIDNDGNEQLWVMNGRGGDQRQLTGNQLIQNMAWSPDGTQLMVAANNAADIWYDLYLIDVESGAMSDFSLAPTGHDYYLGGWSPDGEYINFSDLRYRQQGGQWGLTEISLRRIRSSGCCMGSLSNGELALATDWRSADITPPVIQIEALPQYSSRNTADIHWRGIDSGLARVASYDVQIKSATDREWQDWYMDTSNEQRRYNAGGGETISFRVRVYDEAGNISNWSENVSTTFYYIKRYGYVRDVYGVPLPRASVIIESALNPIPIDANGRYEAMLTKWDMTQIEISHIGYATHTALPNLTNFYSLTYYLRDSINLIENGDFEQTEEPIPSWEYNNVFVVHRDGILGAGSATLQLDSESEIAYMRQSVMIRETMNKPHLSFWHRLGFDDAVFEVIVDDGIEERSIFTSTRTSSSLGFANISLDAWVGQTVTITFSYARTSDSSSFKKAIVDDISIGPWLTPIFTQSTSELVPGASSTMLINGENFVETPTVYIGEIEVSEVRKIDEGTLEIDLPEAVHPGIHNLTLVAPSGHASVHEGVIEVGLHSYLPLIIE